MVSLTVFLIGQTTAECYIWKDIHKVWYWPEESESNKGLNTNIGKTWRWTSWNMDHQIVMVQIWTGILWMWEWLHMRFFVGRSKPMGILGRKRSACLTSYTVQKNNWLPWDEVNFPQILWESVGHYSTPKISLPTHMTQWLREYLLGSPLWTR